MSTLDMHALRDSTSTGGWTLHDIASTGGWTCMPFVTLSLQVSVDMHVLRDIVSTCECGHACPS